MGSPTVLFTLISVIVIAIFFAEAHHVHRHVHGTRLKRRHGHHVHVHGARVHGTHVHGRRHHHHHHHLHRSHSHGHAHGHVHLRHRHLPLAVRKVILRKRRPGRRLRPIIFRKRPNYGVHIHKKRPVHVRHEEEKELINLNGYVQPVPNDFFAPEQHDPTPQLVIGFGSPNAYEEGPTGKLKALEIPIVKVEQLADADKGVYQYRWRGNPSTGAETYVFVKLDQSDNPHH